MKKPLTSGKLKGTKPSPKDIQLLDGATSIEKGKPKYEK
jgi:hypothetical protein